MSESAAHDIASGVIVPDEVIEAFAEDAAHPERRITVTPDELRRWAETGEWPESLG